MGRRTSFAVAMRTTGILLVLAAGEARAIEGSISFQAGAAGKVSDQALPAGFGFSGHAGIDLQIAPSIALGLGTELTAFANGNSRVYIDGTRLYGRWTPLPSSDWNPYLLLGLGFRPLSQIVPHNRWWLGDLSSTVGVGLRHPLADFMDLDLTAFYEGDPSTSGDLLSSFGGRAGFAFPFDLDGNSKGPRALSKSKGSATAPADHYEVQSGDSLWKISKKHYGKGHDWKRIYEANQDKLAKPGLIRPKTPLAIPGAEKEKEAEKGE
ncbi:MAG TPA: LysM peptidoglycan-binding domain-containing protein [bacterium]|nr:LysM peptidoglycan-binding domain-containing protein [bacterium]